MTEKEKLPSHALDGEEGSLSELKERFAKAHARGLNIANALPASNTKLREELEGCWQWANIRHYPKHLDEAPFSKVTRAVSCKHYRLCPACAIRRGVKTSLQVREKFDALGLRSDDLYMVTITIKNNHNLRQTFNKLRYFYKSLTMGRRNALRRPTTLATAPWGAVDAWLGQMEFTASEHGWHPHYHFLILPKMSCIQSFAETKIPVDVGNKKGYWNSEFTASLGRKLFEFTGDSTIVHLKKVDDRDKAIMETTKYFFKFPDLSDKQIVEVYNMTKGKRLASTGGEFRGVKMSPDSLLDSLSDEETRPYIDYYLKWMGEEYRETIQEVFEP